MTASTEKARGRRGGRFRVVAWVAAALVLLTNLVIMQFTDEPGWSLGDFVFAGGLMFGALGTYEVAARMTGNTAYRAAVGVALAAAFVLVWINGAVGITDSEADEMYLAVLAIGIVGALVARFRPAGMARAMFAAALATASIGVIALIAGIVPAHNSAFEILGLNGFFVTLWIGSALLFREAARERTKRSAA